MAKYRTPKGAIGHKDDMTEAQLKGKVIDGQNGFVFNTMEAWEQHIDPISGVKPTDPAYLGDHFKFIQQSALRRGAQKTKGEEKSRTENALKGLTV